MTGPNDPTEPTEVSPPQWAAPSAALPPTGAAPEPPPAASAHETPVSPVRAVRGTARRRGPVDIVLVIAAIFAIGGIGFAVGRVTAPDTTIASAPGGGRFPAGGGQLPGGGQGGQGQGGQGLGGVFGAGGVTISGEVVSVTATELSLKLASGQTIQIPLDSSTTYHSQAPATAAEVTTGATVQIQVGRGIGSSGPNASPGAGGTGGGTTGGGRFELGPATSVTVVPR